VKRVLTACLMTVAVWAHAATVFQLAREDGRAWVSPGHLQGRPSVFLFWDSECAPCLKELANLSHAKAAFPDAVFVAVSLSSRDETRRALAAVALDPQVIRAMGPDSPAGLLAALGNPGGALPFTAAFTADGRACLHGLGPATAELLQRAAEACAAGATATAVLP